MILSISKSMVNCKINIDEDFKGASNKVHTVHLVKIKPWERLATTSKVNPGLSLITKLYS